MKFQIRLSKVRFKVAIQKLLKLQTRRDCHMQCGTKGFKILKMYSYILFVKKHICYKSVCSVLRIFRMTLKCIFNVSVIQTNNKCLTISEKLMYIKRNPVQFTYVNFAMLDKCLVEGKTIIVYSVE